MNIPCLVCESITIRTRACVNTILEGHLKFWIHMDFLSKVAYHAVLCIYFYKNVKYTKFRHSPLHQLMVAKYMFYYLRIFHFCLENPDTHAYCVTSLTKIGVRYINNNYRLEFTSDNAFELTCVGSNPPVSWIESCARFWYLDFYFIYCGILPNDDHDESVR